MIYEAYNCLVDQWADREFSKMQQTLCTRTVVREENSCKTNRRVKWLGEKTSEIQREGPGPVVFKNRPPTLGPARNLLKLRDPGQSSLLPCPSAAGGGGGGRQFTESLPFATETNRP